MARTPDPPADFIDDLLLSIARRGKALKRKLRTFAVDRVADRVEVDRRKLEITFSLWGGHEPVVRIFAWDDRWIWVDVRRATKSDGWLWAYTNEGRLIGGLGGRGLVEGAEMTIAACHEMTCERVWQFDEIWTPILAAGPQAIT